MLGLRRGTLEGSAAHWLEFVHPTDRDRFRAALDGLLEHRRGRLIQASGCAGPTITIYGSPSRRGRLSAPTAKWCGSSAR